MFGAPAGDGPRWGFTVRLGEKPAGHLPGKPLDEGSYLGFGLLASW